MTRLPIYTDDHDLFRRMIRDFVATEITPYVNEWDEAAEFPRELYRKAGEVGLFGIGFETEYGGLGIHDPMLFCILSEELARCGGGGVPAGPGC
jgi:acyl-CoA dehydrogenase